MTIGLTDKDGPPDWPESLKAGYEALRLRNQAEVLYDEALREMLHRPIGGTFLRRVCRFDRLRTGGPVDSLLLLAAESEMLAEAKQEEAMEAGLSSL